MDFHLSDKLAAFLGDLGIWGIPAAVVTGTSVNLLGFIPSVAVTAVNVLLFGPWLGFFLSWCGEILGSFLAFLLFRKGIRAAGLRKHLDWNWVKTLSEMSSKDKFAALLMARLLPLMPSGAVNLAASLTGASVGVFLLSTAIGKVPSLLLETLISQGLIHPDEHGGRLILGILVTGLAFIWFRKRNKPLR